MNAWSRLRRGMSLAAVLLAGGIAGCDSAQQADSVPAKGPAGDGRPAVAAVNYPLAYFAERLAGDAVEVRFPAPAEVDPAYWRPDPQEIAAFQTADRILDNGADYAKWMQAATLPDSSLVDTTARVSDQLIEVDDLVEHSHGPGEKHTHGGVAFTTWLDPQLAMEQSARVADALKELVPQRSDAIEEQLRKLHQDLQRLEDANREALQAGLKSPWLASHPVYQYFARRFGLNLKSVHWEPDQTPDAAQWDEFDALLQEHPAAYMLWEDEPTAATRQGLEQRKIRIVVLRPGGNRCEGDLLEQWKIAPLP